MSAEKIMATFGGRYRVRATDILLTIEDPTIKHFNGETLIMNMEELLAEGKKLEFIKDDAGKPRYDLIPADAIHEVAKVLEVGSRKYEDNNWSRGCAWHRYSRAALGHIFEWLGGKNIDDGEGGSQCSPLANAICCLLFLLSYELRKIGTDDRDKRIG